MKLLELLILIKLVSGSFVIDDSVREFRRDFLKFKATSFHAVDRAFFEVYNTLNIQLLQSFEPVQNFHTMWDDLCNKTMKLDLVKKTNRRWFSACKNVNKMIIESRENMKQCMDEFYSPGILEPTPTALVLDDVISKIELLHMEKMWKIYVKNSSCVSSMLGNYFPSFEPIVDNLLFIVNLTKADIPTFFNLSSNLEEITFALDCIHKTEKCTINNNASKCLERSVSFNWKLFMNDFKFSLFQLRKCINCENRSNCGVVFSFLKNISKNSLLHVKNFKKHFNRNLEVASNISHKVEENFWKWKISTSECFG